MVTSISGKHMEVGESLQEHVNNRLSGGVKKYLNHITQAKVTFSKRHHIYHADIIIHDTHVGLIKAEAESEDAYAAFDNASVKIEKQLRKYLGRIRDLHKRQVVEDDIFSGTKYILNTKNESEHHDHHNTQHHEPVTIAEKATDIEKLTVSEAIMKMDLAHLPALLFINKTNNRINVVYHRADGNISWVDPGK